MTEILYYRDTDKIEFEARVVEAVKENNQWRISLDKTCFYPEGGGQPADKGWLNKIPVEAVQKQGDTIYHYLAQHPGEVAVKGKIDLLWRRDFMQQHSGQHIISGALWKIGKYKTLSVHMGTDCTTIEIDAPRIPEHDLIQVEKMANQVIRDDLPLDFITTTQQELHRFPLRKPVDRWGVIRLVRIGDFDCVGCGGLHVASTRQVGLVKAVGIEKIRDHARIAWKIGDRAFEDYRVKDCIVSQLKALLATNETMLNRKVSDLCAELSEVKRYGSGLETRLADIMAEQLYQKGKIRPDSALRLITTSWKGESPSLMKKIVKNLLKRESTLFCLVNLENDKLHWSIGVSENIDFPFTDFKVELLTIIGGKGGGRSPLWQGTGSKPGNAEAFLAKFKELATGPMSRGL
jgi:alanyl-tRNA synthetase